MGFKSDLGTTTCGLHSTNSPVCPESVGSRWKYWDGEEWLDSQGNAKMYTYDAKEIVSRSKGEVDNFLVTCLSTCVGLQAKITHRSGDADLYGKEESKPVISDSDCQN